MQCISKDAVQNAIVMRFSFRSTLLHAARKTEYPRDGVFHQTSHEHDGMNEH